MPTGANPNAWRNWYHLVGSTYGTWLRGDPRGFRTFRHRQHVEGDYHNPPPPGVFAPIFERSKATLKYPPVMLTVKQRTLLCDAMIERLQDDDCEPLALAIAVHHFHLLARFPLLNAEEQTRLANCTLQDGRDPAPRHFISRSRKHASHVLRDNDLKPASAVWAKRPKCDPIRDRQHQVNVFHYVIGHLQQGAAVWDVAQKRVRIDRNAR